MLRQKHQGLKIAGGEGAINKLAENELLRGSSSTAAADCERKPNTITKSNYRRPQCECQQQRGRMPNNFNFYPQNSLSAFSAFPTVSPRALCKEKHQSDAHSASEYTRVNGDAEKLGVHK